MGLIGLSGSHRVGKTTLAREYAKRHGALMVETSVSAIFRDLGYDPADKFDFKTRLMLQEQVLERVDAIYKAVPAGAEGVCDRTPLDMLAYTLSECSGDAVAAEDQARLFAYIEKCFDVCNKRFSTILVVQPGIELVAEPGKAVINKAYIEQLNALVLGLTVGGRLKAAHYFIPRQYLDLEDRIKAMKNALQATQRSVASLVEQYREAGCLVH